MKRISILFVSFFLYIFFVSSAQALEKTADSSAKLGSLVEKNNTQYIIQSRTMKSVLSRYDSVLVNQADYFLDASYKYDLDPYLLVSISGLESGFGRAMIDETYNAYGWGGGTIYFDSWEDGIETISAGLRNNYYNKGAKTVSDVGRIYAASPTWAVRVQGFMNTFRKEEAKQKELLSVI